MSKDGIKKIIGDSKEALGRDHADYGRSVRESLSSLKKKTLDQV